MDPVDTVNRLISIAVFGLVFSVWCICILLWLGRYLLRLKVVQKRLGVTAKETGESRTLRLWREMYKDGEGPQLLRKLSRRERLERFGQAAGWQTPAQTVILGLVGASGLAFLATYAFGGGILLAAGVSASIMLIFSEYTQSRISKRADLFDRQFLDALSVANRALRAGHPLVSAFQMVSGEINEPLGPIFAQICQEQSMGLDLKDSLRKAVQTTRSVEFRLFATAVAIQLTTGGNLADLMDSVSAVIRARMKLTRRLRVVTAQIRLSKRVLIGIPITLFFLLSILNPEYMAPLHNTPIGRWMLVVAALGVLFGSWVMKRLTVLRY